MSCSKSNTAVCYLFILYYLWNMNAFESCFAALCRWRETTWPRCTSTQKIFKDSWALENGESMGEWPSHLEWMKILTTIPITTVCLSPYTTTSIYHLLSQCSLSYKLTKRNFGANESNDLLLNSCHFNCSIIWMVSSVGHFTFSDGSPLARLPAV